MTNPIDTLTEWYANAERVTRDNLPNDGDTIIYPTDGGAYTIEPATFGWVASIIQPDEEVRILARAPKPEPAWHDAVAVIAHADYCERQVWERVTTHAIRWDGTAGDGAITSDLRDVTPLIEAKVTEEMADRGFRAAINWEYRPRPDTTITLDLGDEVSRALVDRILTAALGLENA